MQSQEHTEVMSSSGSGAFWGETKLEFLIFSIFFKMIKISLDFCSLQWSPPWWYLRPAWPSASRPLRPQFHPWRHQVNNNVMWLELVLSHQRFLFTIQVHYQIHPWPQFHPWRHLVMWLKLPTMVPEISFYNPNSSSNSSLKALVMWLVLEISFYN